MRILLILIGALVIFSCKNNTQSTEDTSVDIKTGTAIKDTREEAEAIENDAIENEDNRTNTSDDKNLEISGELPNGTYINTENEDADTGCNMLMLNYSAPTSLCIDKEGITISVNYKKNGQNTEVFFNGLVENKSDKKIPFNTFDKNVPIAVITQKTNNSLTLDWKGFSVNGDLAIDYAILGKKNLEGDFKKQ